MRKIGDFRATLYGPTTTFESTFQVVIRLEFESGSFPEGHEPSPTRRQLHASLNERPDVIPSGLCVGDGSTQILGVHDGFGEEVEVHILVVLIQRIHFVPIFAELLLQLLIRLGEGFGMHGPLNRIHRMFHGDTIDAQPLDLAPHAPSGKIRRRAGMFDHVAEFVRVRAIPAEAIPSGLDQENVAVV